MFRDEARQQRQSRFFQCLTPVKNAPGSMASTSAGGTMDTLASTSASGTMDTLASSTASGTMITKAGSLRSTSASGTMNILDLASPSESVDDEQRSSRRHAEKASSSSSTIVPIHDSITCQLATAAGFASRTCAEPYEASESLCAVLHMLTAQSLEICKKDDSVASTSASEAVNKEDGFWASASSSGSVDHETDSPRQRATEEFSSSNTIVPPRDLIACEPATLSGGASGTCADPYVAAESLCAVLHMLNAESVQICNEDGSLASTSASATVNKQDGSWDSASPSGFVAPETDSMRRHAVKDSVSSSIVAPAGDLVACEFAIAPGVTRIRAAPYMAPESLCAVSSADARNLEEFATSQIREVNGSLPSTSVSRIANKEDGLSAVSPTREIVSHEAALDLEQAVISKDDGRVLKVSHDAAAEHQVVSAARLAPTLGNTPRPGLVSQPLTEFAKRSQGLTVPSFATAECMPERGLVPQRIQQFQSFIDRV